MFHQIFLSPQVKRRVFISNKQGLYELPHELPNDLKLRILGNKEKKLAKNYWKRENEPLPHGAISHEKHSLPQISLEWLQTVYPPCKIC